MDQGRHHGHSQGDCHPVWNGALIAARSLLIFFLVGLALQGVAWAQDEEDATESTTVVDASPPLVSALDDSFRVAPGADIYGLMESLDCADVSRVCQQVIPSLFVAGRPDSLVELVYYWEDTCGVAEPITRSFILGAIWDRAFDEDLYGDEIMDFLIWYLDPVRQEDPGDEVRPELASGDVASPADFTPEREAFDAFTRDVADQLLPHTEPETPEHFFCLFYSGRTRQAWQLLEGDALKGTYLKRQYDWELEWIAMERKVGRVLVTVGYWDPGGNLATVGEHTQLGLFMEMRGSRLIGRYGVELLLGRSAAPYEVDQPEGSGRSDRFNVITLLAEGGYNVLHTGGHTVSLFAGVGLDYLGPFMEEDAPTDVALLNFKGILGGGYRMDVGRNKRWTVGADVRWEWMPDRNGGGTPLDGTAWNYRLTFSYNRNHELDRRLRALGR